MNNLALHSHELALEPPLKPLNDVLRVFETLGASLKGFFMSETRLIPLTQGQFAIVDAEDYDFLIQWKWYAFKKRRTFYAVRTTSRGNGKQRAIHMHRVINQTPDGMETDHINGDGLDNRRCNLRSATRSQNALNQRAQNDRSSKYKGVRWHKPSGKWLARIQVNGKRKHIGLFTSEEAACDAYNTASLEHHGEFSRLIERIPEDATTTKEYLSG